MPELPIFWHPLPAKGVNFYRQGRIETWRNLDPGIVCLDLLFHLLDALLQRCLVTELGIEFKCLQIHLVDIVLQLSGGTIPVLPFLDQGLFLFFILPTVAEMIRRNGKGKMRNSHFSQEVVEFVLNVIHRFRGSGGGELLLAGRDILVCALELSLQP